MVRSRRTQALHPGVRCSGRLNEPFSLRVIKFFPIHNGAGHAPCNNVLRLILCIVAAAYVTLLREMLTRVVNRFHLAFYHDAVVTVSQ